MFTKIDLDRILPDETFLLDPYVEFMEAHRMRFRLEPCMTRSGVGYIVHLMGLDGIERTLPHVLPDDPRVPDHLQPARALKHAQGMLQVLIDGMIVDGDILSKQELRTMMVGKVALQKALTAALPDLRALQALLDEVGEAMDFVWLSRIPRTAPAPTRG